MSNRPAGRSAFSLIELMAAVVILAIIAIPVGLTLMELMRSAANTDSAAVATNIIRREMAVINRLSYDDPTLANLYDIRVSNYAGTNLDLRRSVRYVAGTGNRIKRVTLTVYPRGSQTALGEIVTNISIFQFGAGSNGSYLEFSTFRAAGGVLLNIGLLNDVTLTNGNINNSITITQLLVMVKGSSGALTSVDHGGRNYFTGSIPLARDVPTAIVLQLPLVIPAQTLSPAERFRIITTVPFKSNDTLYVKFIFSDGSKGDYYTWQPE